MLSSCDHEHAQPVAHQAQAARHAHVHGLTAATPGPVVLNVQRNVLNEEAEGEGIGGDILVLAPLRQSRGKDQRGY
jgi:hypothetical protein